MEMVTTVKPGPTWTGYPSSGGAGRVLVVDDEPNIVDLLQASLGFAGFEVRTAAHGQEALRLIREDEPDIVLLDVMMPGMDGWEVVRRLRTDDIRVPVLFLTARDATEDRVAGLTLGGDDYVTKPFSLGEVVARIQAILRRTRPGDDDGSYQSAVLRYEDLTLDEDGYEVTRAGRVVELSPTEFKLLRYLLVNADHVVSKSQILDQVWSYDFSGDPTVVESYISSLRRKLALPDESGVRDGLIRTVRGVGYVLRRPRN
jgi:two-component system OmpR family response regulator